MPADERYHPEHADPGARSSARRGEPPRGPSVSVLLASCAAARAVSTPPTSPENQATAPTRPEDTRTHPAAGEPPAA